MVDFAGLAWRHQSTAAASQPKPLQPVKPASRASDLKSLGTLLALRTTWPENFINLAGCWAGQLLVEGQLYQEAVTGQYIFSLGFKHLAGLSWTVDEVCPGYFQLASQGWTDRADRCRERLQPFCTYTVAGKDTNEEELYAGVPTSVCALKALAPDKPKVLVSDRWKS